ncbi:MULTISPECIES: tetracycline resistance ribosomal protection protein Otr(A) [unclassified Streptomyces]|uniref:tetracycline resistance ribosomal protection protein Otr(A) n=1 Tax=unclassified Streptomyces TaxID=2593676 RepID=UPI00035F75B5|nr:MULTISPECIES: tetracycline resistance ribosomal protection protein Otr(A) [unclassified Streptomyces]MYT31410.1 tetracycline resistance ribosomal protection protein Otr(A) [Streptomyces sp. SID8354]
MHIQHTLNIGILAHVDAGKTSLTERLLFDTGAIDRLGSVDAGDTQTDTGLIERQRGITVRSAVASFTAGTTQVNLIDTPGHSDFVAEVERVLGVLDGAVLVLSAVEGVQAHTRVLMRTLRDMRLPVLLFVNKIDRLGARDDALLADIRRKLAPHLVPMTTVRELGTSSARVLSPALKDDPEFRTRVAEALAEIDDALLARVVDGPYPSADELRAALAAHTRNGTTHPVHFGSARSGAGIGALVDGITGLLGPAPTGGGAAPDGAAPPRGTVFAVEREPSGRKTAYLRLFTGTLAARQRVALHRNGPDGAPLTHHGQITALHVVGRRQGGGGARQLTPGNIARIGGLAEVRVGDRLTDPAGRDDDPRPPRFPAPTLRTLVRPRDAAPGAASRLHAALQHLSEQDPLIHAGAGPDGATTVLLYGEIQKEILAATLAHDFGIEAVFEPTRTVLLERPVGVGEASEEIGRRVPGPSGFWATIGLRVEPGQRGSGVAFRYETELGALPHAFHTAIEETVHSALRSGPRGWAVTDCAVTLTRSGFVGPLSTAGDFRGLTPLVLRRALADAGTQLYEPCHTFDVDIPLDTLPAVTSCLAALGADLVETAGGTTSWLVKGMIPASRVRAAEHRLPRLTRGEALWWSRPDGDRPVGRPAARTPGR